MKPTSCKSVLSIILVAANALNLVSTADVSNLCTSSAPFRDPEIKIIGPDGKFLQDVKVKADETLLCAIVSKKLVEGAFAAQEKANEVIPTSAVSAVVTTGTAVPSSSPVEQTHATSSGTSDHLTPGTVDQTSSQAIAPSNHSPAVASVQNPTTAEGAAITDASASISKAGNSDGTSTSANESKSVESVASTQTPGQNGKSSQIHPNDPSSGIIDSAASSGAIAVASPSTNTPDSTEGSDVTSEKDAKKLSPANTGVQESTSGSIKSAESAESSVSSTPTSATLPIGISTPVAGKPGSNEPDTGLNVIGKSNSPADLISGSSPVSSSGDIAAQTEVTAADVKKAIDSGTLSEFVTKLNELIKKPADSSAELNNK